MKSLPILDISIILIYLLAMVLVGFYFSKKNKNSEQFTTASGKIPGWAIGLSIYATFLSSNTFLGVPGKAFGTKFWSLGKDLCGDLFFAYANCTHGLYLFWNCIEFTGLAWLSNARHYDC